MKFYHIELATEKIIQKFIPRIPNEILENEDITTPRICVSTSLEGCLNAVPWGRLNFDYIPMCQPIRVYEFDENDYISSLELFSSNKVEDAMLTGECWLLQESVPINSYIIINVEGDMETINLDNSSKKTYTYFSKLRYKMCHFSDFSKNFSLKNIKHSFSKENFELICNCVINFYFDFWGSEWINNIEFIDDNIIITSDYLFSEIEFLKRLKEELMTRELSSDFI